MAKLLEKIRAGQNLVVERYDPEECYEATVVKILPFGILVTSPFTDPDSHKTGTQNVLLLDTYENLVLQDMFEDTDFGSRAWRCWDEMPSLSDRRNTPWEKDMMTPDDDYPYLDIDDIDLANREKTGKAVLVDSEKMEAGMLVWTEYYHLFESGTCLQPLFVDMNTEGLGDDDYLSFIPNAGLLYPLRGKAHNKRRYWNCKPTKEERENMPWSGEFIYEDY